MNIVTPASEIEARVARDVEVRARKAEATMSRMAKVSAVLTPASGSDNQLRRMGEKPSNEPFKPMQIVHARLLLVPVEANPTARVAQQMTFGMKLDYGRDDIEVTPEAVHQYARDVADGKIVMLSPKGAPAPSPFDISVASQCWVVLELEKEWTNWQFERDAFVVTTKADYGSDNHTLRYVFPTGHAHASDPPADVPIPDDGCRVVYFGVARRGFPESQFVNIHTEFLQDNPKNPSGPKHRLRVIFDPDVPNSGPDAIPP